MATKAKTEVLGTGVSQIPGGDYSNGPKYDKELEDCIKVLKEIK